MEIELDWTCQRRENKTKKNQQQQKQQQQRENHEIIVHDDVQYIIHSHWTPAPGAVDLKGHCTNPFECTERKSRYVIEFEYVFKVNWKLFQRAFKDKIL